jgi:hypothetical protein
MSKVDTSSEAVEALCRSFRRSEGNRPFGAELLEALLAERERAVDRIEDLEDINAALVAERDEANLQRDMIAKAENVAVCRRKAAEIERDAARDRLKQLNLLGGLIDPESGEWECHRKFALGTRRLLLGHKGDWTSAESLLKDLLDTARDALRTLAQRLAFAELGFDGTVGGLRAQQAAMLRDRILAEFTAQEEE